MCKTKHRPPVVDSQNKALPADVWAASGDVVKVSVGLGGWTVRGAHGISAYLNGVQIIDKRGAAGGFDAVEGGWSVGGKFRPETPANDHPKMDAAEVSAKARAKIAEICARSAAA